MILWRQKKYDGDPVFKPDKNDESKGNVPLTRVGMKPQKTNKETNVKTVLMTQVILRKQIKKNSKNLMPY